MCKGSINGKQSDESPWKPASSSWMGYSQQICTPQRPPLLLTFQTCLESTTLVEGPSLPSISLLHPPETCSPKKPP